MLEKNSDNLDFSFENVKINSVLIEEIPDLVSPNGKRKGISKLDFLLGL